MFGPTNQLWLVAQPWELSDHARVVKVLTLKQIDIRTIFGTFLYSDWELLTKEQGLDIQN